MSPVTAPGHDYQVAVIGGGPAGCAAALALRLAGIDGVRILESGDYQGVGIGESIPPDSRMVLDQLGAWEDFLAQEHEPFLGSCSAWGAETLGYNDFLFNPHGTGWHLDRRRFDSLLARRAVGQGAELRLRSRLIGAWRTGETQFELRLAQDDRPPRIVRTRVVVDATGRRSWFARAMGARPLFHDRLSCVTGFLRLPAASCFPRLTMLEAVKYGWWSAARLPGGRLAVMLASDPEIVRRARLHVPENWLAALRATNHLGTELTDSQLIGERVVARTAPSFVLDHSGGSDWLAVGDAAAACDPISAQGIHNALRDGQDTAKLIVAKLRGDHNALDEWHEAVELRFADYLGNRNYFYDLERRWHSAPFWHRRRQRAVAG